MPIRFRCAYCNQLMGIARRKAGTVVRCPTCSGQVVVPDPDAAGAPGPGPADQLFERSDFEQIFEPAVSKERPAAPAGGGTAEAPPAGAWGTEASPNFDVGRPAPPEPLPVPPPAPPPGIVLPPSVATLLVVVGILLLAIAFGAGILVGKLALGS